MRPTTARLFMLGASGLFFATVALGQLTVDATGPIRERHREATSGRGGSVGRKLPLQVAIETTGAPPDENGKTVVDFILTNTGKNDLTLPISPHPRDLQPSDPKARYTVRCLGLRMSSGKAPWTIFPGGADLYGRDSIPGTLITLAPGESIRVLTRVALPRNSAPNSGAGVFVAGAILNGETIKIVNGQTVSDMQEIGSAGSSEYTPEALFRSPRN
jgi:hypothetical protein